MGETRRRATRPETARGRPIPAVAFAVFLIIAAALAATVPYPSRFDELEHVSYAAYLQETGEWRPMFESMPTLRRDSLVTWTERMTYLGHPSPFYWYETLFLDRSLPLAAGVLRVRLASAALVAGGVGLALWAGWRRFRDDALALTVFCVLVALCPKLLAMACQVSNDALAVLAGGLAYWGAAMPERRRAGPAACGLGLMLACWAKPNAGLAVGAALGVYALLRLRSRPWALGGALAVGAAAGAVPYAAILAKYGALVPVTVEQFNTVRSIPGVWPYLPAFLFTLAYTFCFDQIGVWPIPGLAAVVTVALVALLLGAIVAGGVVMARRGGAGWALAVAGPAAALLVLPIHFWFSATTLGGSLPAASFRYDLPIWPFMVHALAALIAGGAPGLRWAVAAVAAAAMAAGWLSA